MRRFVLALAVLLGGLAAMVAPAGALSSNPVKNVKKNQVSGPFTGTTTLDSSFPPGCAPFPASQVFDGTYKAPMVGPTGSFHIDGCDFLNGADTQFSYFGFLGTARVTTPAGTLLTGTVSGDIAVNAIIGNGTPNTFDLTLSLSGPGGPITVHLTGTWQTSASGASPISGTLTST